MLGRHITLVSRQVPPTILPYLVLSYLRSFHNNVEIQQRTYAGNMSSIDIISVKVASQNEVFWKKALQFIDIESMFKIFVMPNRVTLWSCY